MKKLDNSQLKMILGGKNSWQQNVWGVARSTAAGAGLGAAICGPGTTGATHGFH